MISHSKSAIDPRKLRGGAAGRAFFTAGGAAAAAGLAAKAQLHWEVGGGFLGQEREGLVPEAFLI
jgi:hypothetical protein